MRRVLVLITTIALLTGCSKDEAVKVKEPVEKAEPKTESVMVMNDENIKKYYTEVTSPAMGAVTAEHNRIKNAYWRGTWDELRDDSIDDIQPNMMQHSIQYHDLRKKIEDIPVGGLGGYKDAVITWKEVMVRTVDARRDASLTILEGISTSTMGVAWEKAQKNISDADEAYLALQTERARIDNALLIRNQ